MSYRETGKKALGSVLTVPKNINIIEKYIHKISVENCGEQNVKDVYTRNIYQTIGDLLEGKTPVSVLNSIKKEQLGWKHGSFNNVIHKQEEQDDFIVNPFEIEEGVIECRCGSKRVFSYSKQCRGSDEPTSIFAECMACKAHWVDNA